LTRWGAGLVLAAPPLAAEVHLWEAQVPLTKAVVKRTLLSVP